MVFMYDSLCRIETPLFRPDTVLVSFFGSPGVDLGLILGAWVPCLEHVFGFGVPFDTNPGPKADKTQKRTPNHKHPDKHGGGHCAAAQLDPHGACGHPSVLGGFAGLLDFADISFKYQIFADMFISCRYLQRASINIC